MLAQITIPSDGGFYTVPNIYVFIDTEGGLGNPDVKLGIHEYGNARGGSFQSQYYRSRRLPPGGWISAPDVATFAQVRRELGRAFSFLNATKTVTGVTDDGMQVQFD